MRKACFFEPVHDIACLKHAELRYYAAYHYFNWQNYEKMLRNRAISTKKVA